MSRVTGFIAHNKKGRTVSKTQLGKKSNKKPQLIPPAKAAEFVAKVKALARRYNIGIQNLKVR
jgi:hypothetical protein